MAAQLTALAWHRPNGPRSTKHAAHEQARARARHTHATDERPSLRTQLIPPRAHAKIWMPKPAGPSLFSLNRRTRQRVLSEPELAENAWQSAIVVTKGCAAKRGATPRAR